LFPGLAAADAGTDRLTLAAAVTYALAHNPAAAEKSAEVEATTAATDSARDAYLPALDVGIEIDRATANVPPGAYVPFAGLPAVTGPPTGRSLSSGAWGSVASATLSWVPVDFGQRAAAVDAALAQGRGADAALQATRLEVAYQAADAYLAVAQASESARAAHAAIDRAQVVLSTLKPLVEQGLRPGADEARAAAELAAAETSLARAQSEEGVAMATLARTLGAPNADISIDEGAAHALATRLPALPASAPTSAPVTNPYLIEATAAVDAADAQTRETSASYAPRLALVGSVFARGSGFFPGGFKLGPAQGLVPDTPNWLAGAVVTWPVFDYWSLRDRAAEQSAQATAAQDRQQEISDEIAAQVVSAQRALDGAIQVAAATPVALSAAQADEAQARARYESGLSSITDLANAEDLLAQAERDDAVARMAVLRAWLLRQRAVGDLGPFFDANSEAH
jgi:outer membrane protein TolC